MDYKLGVTRASIKKERRLLLKEPEFAKGVEELYRKVITENPDLGAVIDEAKQREFYFQQDWKTRHKEWLKEYRKNSNFTYSRQNKCFICGAPITNNAIRCRKCFARYMEKRKVEDNGWGEQKSNEVSRLDTEPEGQGPVQETIPRVPTREERTVQDVSVLQDGKEVKNV
jgi:ribosomal protein L40E